MGERGIAGLVAVLCLGCPWADAHDRWEGTVVFNDDSYLTSNLLVHPTVQLAHDLEVTTPPLVVDQDWMITRTRPRRSYEARVRSSTLVLFDSPNCPDPASCALFDRVDSSGAVLTAGEMDGPYFQDGNDNVGTTLVVRWIAAADQTDFLRVLGIDNLAAVGQYDLEFHETTCFAPRFNNSATQVTVLALQNTTSAPLSGNAYFHDVAGTLLHSQPISLAPEGGLVLNTSTIGALQGQAGHVVIAHLGPYGALSGKLVALEPATGFTFDTLLLPLPR